MRLARSDRVGPATYRALVSRYGTAEAALASLPELARQGGGAPPRLASAATAEREFAHAAKAGAHLLFVDTPDYPPWLALMDHAPAVIAVLGDPAHLSRPSVAIVGSRHASANGCTMADMLADGLAQARLAVVSGLARGIDGAAHRGALRDGITVAAVAGGLDRPYPPEHAALQAEIAEKGAVMSEAPFGTAPVARLFHRRNRLIAGLSLGVVVVEAALRSGSLITARFALEEGRELFAVPGSPLDPRCRGTNGLIRDGAHLTETVQDILSNLPDHPSRVGVARLPLFERGEAPHLAEPRPDWSGAPPSEAQMRQARQALLSALGPSPVPIDDLIAHCQVTPAAAAAILLELELAGRVHSLPGRQVALAAPGGRE